MYFLIVLQRGEEPIRGSGREGGGMAFFGEENDGRDVGVESQSEAEGERGEGLQCRAEPITGRVGRGAGR